MIGGDTTKSFDKLSISITAIGTARAKNIKYYNAAKPGDLICIVDNLGCAHSGLTIFESNL
ncbi:MAG: hypothetical protein MTP17_02510 [Candidatus Midichloria sp.]|nr:MAG: hypothetical protein MTP17_02510 [Candidatus Midichloria sp.]